MRYNLLCNTEGLENLKHHNIMKIDLREEENLLFKEWKLKRPNFIPDGVVDETCYSESSIKVLFILKEVNGGKDWDLRNYLKGGGRASTLNNIARWQYGIKNINKEITYDKIKSISQEFRKEQLKSIVVMNIKKESGGATAIPKLIWTYSWDDKEFLKKQIALYKSDIIVCCGTGEMIKERELVTKFDKWEISSSGVKYFKYTFENKIQLIINFCHPAIRANAKEKFYLLTKTLKEII